MPAVSRQAEMTAFPSAEISAAYGQGSPQQQACMAELRELVFETARGLQGIGTISESLKWGQPTFSTSSPRLGSPFRIAALRDDESAVGLYFICTTTLVGDFRERYGNDLVFEGNRAIILDSTEALPGKIIAHCMAMALTYNKR